MSEVKPDQELGTRATSERKLVANQKNAKKSTGPKTDRGKSMSRRNALKNGFTVKDTGMSSFVNPGEERQHQQLLRKLRQELGPVGELEDYEVQQIAIARLRLGRVWNAEGADIYCGARKMSISLKVFDMEAAGLLNYDDTLIQEWKNLAKRDHEVGQLTIQQNSIPRGKELDEILRYKRSAERDLHNAMMRLERLQRKRKGDIVPAPVDVRLTRD
jgi:hypothetical protein